MYLRPKMIGFIIAVLVITSTSTAALGEVVITPSVTLRESFDTNPFAVNRAADADTDFITMVSPDIRLLNERKEYALDAFYTLNARFYHAQPASNYTSHSAGLGFDMEATEKTSVEMGYDFYLTRESLDAIDTGIQTAHNDIRRNTLSLDLDHELKPGIFLSLDLSRVWLDYDAPALFDTRSENASLSAMHRLEENRSARAVYTFTNYRFDTTTGTNNTENHSLSLGITDVITSTTTLDLSVGVDYTPKMENEYDWTAEATIDKTFKRAVASLGYTRAVSNSSGLAIEVSQSERLNLGFSYQFGETFSIRASGAIVKTRSKPSGTIDLSSFFADAGCTWKPYRWLGVSAAYSSFRQWDDLGVAQDVERDRVSLDLIITPNEWRL